MKVRDLMSSDVVTLHSSETLDIADRIMALGRIRHMPVLNENDELVGIVSQRDLFRGALASALGYGKAEQARVLGQLLVKEVMTAEPVTIGADASLADAAGLMLKRKIGCLPVVEGDRLVGLITEADFVAHVARSLAAP